MGSLGRLKSMEGIGKAYTTLVYGSIAVAVGAKAYRVN